MISYKDFLYPIKENCKKNDNYNIEFRFGKVIDEKIFKLELNNIDKYISKIKKKEYSFKFIDLSFYTNGQNNYYLNNDTKELSILRNNFNDCKIDLKSLIDIRIIFQIEKKIKLEDIPEVNKLFLSGQQELIFEINSNINLIIQRFDLDTNIYIRMNQYNEEDIKIVYELYLYIFND